MPARSRRRDISVVAGTGTYLGSPVSRSYTSRFEECDDTIGDFGGNHSLVLKQDERHGSFYVYTTGNLLLPEPGVPTAMYAQVWGVPSAFPALSTYVNRVLATSGPMTPNLNLPLALIELRDVPRMIRHAGNLLHGIKNIRHGLDPIKEAAAANLAYKFGWAPIISDLGKLFGIGEAVLAQQRRIKQAHSKKGVRRRVNLGQLERVYQDAPYIWSAYGHLRTQPLVSTAIATQWATVRWRVRDPNKYGYEPTFLEATKSALGLNLGMIPITVWKALPWSWMIDWFTDISNVLQANYNSIYYKPYRLSIMRTVVDNVVWKPVLNIGGNPANYITGGHMKVVHKLRYANNSPSTSFTLRLPFLDNYKLSVLGSFAVLKSKSRLR